MSLSNGVVPSTSPVSLTDTTAPLGSEENEMVTFSGAAGATGGNSPVGAAVVGEAGSVATAAGGACDAGCRFIKKSANPPAATAASAAPTTSPLRERGGANSSSTSPACPKAEGIDTRPPEPGSADLMELTTPSVACIPIAVGTDGRDSSR